MNFPAIYDFSLLPYALGDVLTWHVKSSILAAKCGFNKLDIHIVLDPKAPSCIHQTDYVTEANYWSHFMELQPAFFTNPNFENVKIHHSRAELHDFLKENLRGNSSPLLSSHVLEYLHTLEHRNDPGKINHFLNQRVSSHQDINQAAAENGSIPLLQSPTSIKNDLLGSGKTNRAFDSFIAVNFRLRAYDESSGPALLSRDSDLQAWIEFFRQAATKHPRLKFAILGKLEEKPEALLKLGNVFFPRLSGQSLGHELAWVECSRLFMGSSSGFAAMANFTKVPYFITRMNERAYANYDIPNGSEKLPFASEEQWLVDEEESPELLMELLERHLEGEGDGSCGEDTRSCDDSDNDLAARHLEQKAIFEEKAASLDSVADLFRQRRYPEVEKSLTPKLYKSLVSDEEKGKFHFMTGETLYSKSEFVEAKNSLLQAILLGIEGHEVKKLAEKINAALLLSNLDRFITRNPDAESSFLGMGKIRAKALLKMGKFQEAIQALNEHLEKFPDDTETEHMTTEINDRLENSLDQPVNEKETQD